MSGVREYLDHLIELLAQSEPTDGFLDAPVMVDWANFAGELSAALAFSDGTELHIYLQVTLGPDFPHWNVYSFHYQRTGGEVIFRYDNAPHHPQLSSFPHHLHIGARELRATRLPTPRDVTAAVRWHLDHPDERWQP